MIQRCPCCIGKKTIIGLGAMIKDCPNCKGVGHIKVVLDHDKVKIQAAPFEGKLPVESIERAVNSVRRGRPKKVSNERKEA
jgi:hypothetical protein